MQTQEPEHGALVSALRDAGCVFAEEEAAVLEAAAGSASELAALALRRASGEPLEYVVGWARFCGLRVPVCPGVFVPRRRTEFLVSCAVEAAARAPAPDEDRRRIRVLDMCCGSGAVGLALASRSGSIELHAVDISPAAVACARRNLAESDARVYEGDLYAALPVTLRHGFDIIATNAPYVPTHEMETLPAEARLFEPRVALEGGADGLDLQRDVIAGAADWLGDHGCLLIETSGRQAERTAQLAIDSGLTPEIRVSDGFDATVVVARRSGGA